MLDSRLRGGDDPWGIGALVWTIFRVESAFVGALRFGDSGTDK